LLKNATQATGPHQQAILHEAFQTFSKVISTVSFHKLIDVVQEFENFKYYEGVINLALSYSSFIPLNPAVIFC
jgi:hypothetical protein